MNAKTKKSKPKPKEVLTPCEVCQKIKDILYNKSIRHDEKLEKIEALLARKIKD